MALLIVLLLVSMALGLSYAAMRSQSTAMQIHRNSGRRNSARHAAITGLTMAIKKMHTAAWAGVQLDGGPDTTLRGSLGDDTSFEVTFITGDTSLSPSDADYEELPYRITLLSTGRATDPDHPASVAEHQLRSVVRLIPRALAAEPADWTAMTTHTVYQYKDDQFLVNVPVRIEGPVRAQAKLDVGRAYQWPNDARARYLGDLGAMRLAGYPDWRPFDGPLYLPYDKQEAGMVFVLGTSMGIATHDMVKQVATNWVHPGEMLTYQIYPGGKVYDATVLAQNHQNVTLQPDPKTNPLGIFYRLGEVRLYDNVTIQGTLVTRGSSGGDVHIFGKNVRLLPHDLPPLEGTDVPVQLPVVVVDDDFRLHGTAQGSVNGLLTIWDDFEIRSEPQYAIDVAFQGGIVAKRIKIRGRSEWKMSSGWWVEKWKEFTDQEDEEGGVRHFPVWMLNRWGLDPNPRVTIKPDPTEPRYHWHNGNDPIYVPHRDDDGLRWDLLEWTENP